MSKIKGIDISYWQGDIDFKKVKMSEDIKFVILREGYRQTMDKKFMDYVFGCRTWGIPISGVYHFIYMMNDRITSNAETGRLNAESCLRNIQNAQLRKDEIIVWCDLEYDTLTHAKRTHGIDLTSQDIREITTSFCNEILKSGYRVGIYTNLDYAKHKYGLDFIKNFDVWLADYTGEADLDCLYHQYTSEGTVSGIAGKVDMNWKLDTNKEESSMGVTAKNILDIMRSWIGYSEANGRYMEILNTYNSHKPLARGYEIKADDEWCDATVSACAIKAGAVDLIGTEVGVEQHVKIFKQKGIWLEDGSITPQSGDIIVFNWNDNVQPNDGWSDHIGYVEYVENGIITTIEGNMHGRVGRRNLKVGHGNIRGFARPRYSNSSTNQPVKPNKPAQTDLTAIAKEVISGVWGNGEDRKNRLESAGYNFDAVQAEVNRILSGAPTKPQLKPLSEIAREVIAGKWGNGTDRKRRLEQAGYNYAQVQAEVNRLSGASSVDINKIAHDVIRGKYGNGSARRNALVRKFGTSVADAVQRRVNQLL